MNMYVAAIDPADTHTRMELDRAAPQDRVFPSLPAARAACAQFGSSRVWEVKRGPQTLYAVAPSFREALAAVAEHCGDIAREVATG